MKKKVVIDIVFIFIIVLCFLFVFAFIPLRSELIRPKCLDVCKYQYGENYIYEFDADFGRYCIELDYKTLTKINPKPFNWTIKEMREICNAPKFFELNKWDSGVCVN